MGTEAERRLPVALEVGPEVAGLVALRLEAKRRQLAAEPLSRRTPLLAPTDASGAPRPPGQLIELAEVGDHLGGVDRWWRRHRSCHLRGNALAAQRLSQAVSATATEREHLQIGIENFEPAGPELSVEVL